MRISKPIERWFDIENDPDKTRLKIKHLLPGETQDIFDKVFVQKVDYKKGKKGKLEPNFSQETDKKLDRELTLAAVVVGWENMFDDKGNKLECTPENVIRVSREIEGFTDLVNGFKEILANDIKEEQESQKKNLRNSVSGQAK
jgi:cation transport regulator ChaB